MVREQIFPLFNYVTRFKLPMAIIKKGLGRGLSALIPESDMEMLRQVARGDDSRLNSTARNTSRVISRNDIDNKNLEKKSISSASTIETKNIANLKRSSVDEIADESQPTKLVSINAIEANPYQPRRYFHEEELENLANSIREHGVIQSIIVRPLSTAGAKGETKYQLIAGERRWRASKIAGIENIPAIVRTLNDQQALELALIENVQRHDISSIDAALAYQKLAREFKLSQEDIARRVGKSRSAIANTLRLLDLSEEIRQSLEKGDLTEGHGRAILLAPGEGARRALYRRVMRDKLSVREVERLAKISENMIDSEVESGTKQQRKEVSTRSELQRIENALQKRLGTRVAVRTRARGGKIIIEYSSVEELQRVIRCLGA